MPLKVMVDENKCATVGICVKELPELFRFKPGSKRAEVIVDSVPPHLEEKCRQVAEKCPNKAIIVCEC
ncbi:ferredoxin [Thermodesulforhabdus norvegica]|uniref:Ferredoxin n=1 Tax=Thermodesulforhabdus norvegica TaxID=39841 RepID=A0A1I4UJB3_9BACT|nr:ferredoxin [Thermodesulforhabdus norvegica]SFM88991.1 Ferredoxin [Thermodesulforhabdus norvegica]